MENLLLFLINGAFVMSVLYMFIKRRGIPNGQSSLAPLSTKEKVLVWIVSMLNPLIAQIIFYYGWASRFPNKASQANIIGVKAFCLVTVILVLLFIVSSL